MIGCQRALNNFCTALGVDEDQGPQGIMMLQKPDQNLEFVLIGHMNQ